MSYVEGSAVRNVFSKRSRFAIVAVVTTAMLGAGLIFGLTSSSVDAAPLGSVVDQTYCYSLDEGTGDPTSDQQWLHEVRVDNAGGVSATKLQPALTDPELIAAGNIENIAVRNDASELYAYDAAADTMFQIDAGDPGAVAPSVSTPTSFNLSGIGDVDAMFFQNDTDGDPANDILWTVVDNAGNDADQLRGWTAAGTEVAGSPVTIDLPDTDPAGNPLGGEVNTIEGATWLPAAAGGSGTFYISYTVTNSPTIVASLATLGSGALPLSTPTRVGDLPIDVEGLGTDGDAQLFVTTGEDGPTPDNLYQVDEAGPTSSLLLDMIPGSPTGGEADFESVDCAYADISLTKTATSVTRNPDGTTDITFEFGIENTGALQLQNVTLVDPMTNYTVVTGPTPAGPGGAGDCSADAAAGTLTLNIGAAQACTATWDYTVDNPPADYDNTATVTGTPGSGLAADVSAQASTTTTIPPVTPPVLEIVKTVVTDAANCPTDVASGADGLDTIQAGVGSNVVYCINVVNNGPGNAENVTVNDTFEPANNLGTLTSGQEAAYNYTRTVGAAPETNSATVTGTDVDGNAVTPDTDEAGTIDIPAPSLEIVKTVVTDAANCPADVASGADGLDTIEVAGGTAVIYCINVINNGPGDAQNVMVTDPQDPSSPRDLGSLANGAEASFDYVVNAPNNSSTNTATVSGEDTGGNPAPTDSDDAGTTPAPPALQVVKTVVSPSTACPADVASGIDGLDTIQASNGETVKYCINVVNNGTGGAFGVEVADDFDPASPRSLGDLAPGAEAAYEYNHVVGAATETNTATVTGNDGDGNASPPDSDQAGTSPTPPGSIGDKVYEDTNADGIQDAGEPPVAGVTVNLWSSVGGSPGAIITSTMTDAAGMYLFPGLQPGNYFVEFDAPGRTFVAANQGADDTVDSDADPATGITPEITLLAGQDDTSVDAGLVPTQARIGNFVWSDDNGNGIQDAGEAGVAGVTVLVWTSDAAGGLISSVPVVTDANGEWTLDVTPGFYRINPVVPAGADNPPFTTQDAGVDDDVDSDIITSGADFGFSPVYTIGAGETNLSIDAGILFPAAPASIGDFVFEDADNDGIQDAGETGIQGITVQVLDGGGAVAGSDITDANGQYLVDNLQPGTYTVNVINTTGGQFSPQDAGADDMLDSDVNASGQSGAVVLGAGETNLSIDAGIFFPPELGSISNFVFEDTDSDGVQDGGEPGVAGVTVNLWSSVAGAPGAVITSTTTDVNGLYNFPGLAAGNYFVEFEAPAGRTFTAQNMGGDDALDSDAAVATGVTDEITLAAGQDDDTVDAGILPVAPPPPTIGLAKDVVGAAEFVGNGQFRVTYSFVIENLGSVTLTNVVLTDDFDATFVGATVVSGPTPATTGCSQAVAGAGTTLAPGESCIAIWSVIVTNLVSGQTYNNTATATGSAPDGSMVDDISDDGVVTDTDGDGNPDEPGENDPTPIVITVGTCQQVNPPASCDQTPTGCLDNAGNPSELPCLFVEDPGPFQTKPEPPESIPAPAPAEEPLAFTGSSTSILATLALALMGLGGALMIGARRRNEDDED